MITFIILCYFDSFNQKANVSHPNEIINLWLAAWKSHANSAAS